MMVEAIRSGTDSERFLCKSEDVTLCVFVGILAHTSNAMKKTAKNEPRKTNNQTRNANSKDAQTYDDVGRDKETQQSERATRAL